MTDPAPSPPPLDSFVAPEGVYKTVVANTVFPPIPQAPAVPPNPGSPFGPMAGAGGGGFMGAAAAGLIMGTGGGMMMGGPMGYSPRDTQINLVNGGGSTVKMAWITINFKAKSGQGFGGLLGKSGDANGASAQQQANKNDNYEASITSSDSTPPSSEANTASQPEAAMSPQGSSSKKLPFTKGSNQALPRPKNNLRSSNSTFVTRMQTCENLSKVLADRAKAGETVKWGFWNYGRTVCWGEEGGRIKEPLARVTFSHVPTCVAINHLTTTSDRMDLVIGFQSGDLVWLDFISGRYSRLNKGGITNPASVQSVHFDPRSPNLFLAVYTAPPPVYSTTPDIPKPNALPELPLNQNAKYITQFNLYNEDPPISVSLSTYPWANSFAAATANGTKHEGLRIWKNDGKDEQVGPGGKSAWAGKNPVAVFQVVDAKPITGMAYSPDARWLATVSMDGLLRIVDAVEERLVDTFAGYFGGLSCVAWSPDGRYIATGGQDDLITIFSPRESRIVARCQGHSSFVTSLAFDLNKPEGKGYRFGSVGEDGKVILWDFSTAMLHRPRHHQVNNASHHRLPKGSSVSLAGASRTDLSTPVMPTGGRFHPAPPRSEVALLQPVVAKATENTVLISIHMLNNAILTMSRTGVAKFWMRPPRKQNASRRSSRGRETSVGA